VDVKLNRVLEYLSDDEVLSLVERGLTTRPNEEMRYHNPDIKITRNGLRLRGAIFRRNMDDYVNKQIPEEFLIPDYPVTVGELMGRSRTDV